MKDVSPEQSAEAKTTRPATKSGGVRLVEVRIDAERSRFSLPASRLGKRILALVVAFAIVAGIIATQVGPWTSKVPEGAAFVIGDQVVTKGDLDKRMDTLRALYGVVAPKEAKALADFRRNSAKSFVVSLILDEQQKKRKITVSDKQAGDVLDRFILQQFGDGGRQEFVRSLGNVGTSEKEVLDEIRRQVSVELLMGEIIGTVDVSDKELASAFAARKKQLATPELRSVQNIVVADEAGAQAVYQRVTKGEALATVAADVSIDESTRDEGGDLGQVSFDQLEKPVATAIFGVSKGQLYGPVKGEHGWNVGFVKDVHPAVAADLQKIGEEFRQRLKVEKSRDKWRAWLSKQIRAADVEYADQYRPANPDAAPPIGSNDWSPGEQSVTPSPGEGK